MSRPSEHPITCEGCGDQQKFTAWDSINATLNPELKDRLVKGDLNTFVCPSCSHRTTVEYGTLYHDMERRYMIALQLDEQEPRNELATLHESERGILEGYRFRLVHSRPELIDKIHVLDHGFDDRRFELFRLLVRGRLADDGISLDADVYFEGREDPVQGEAELNFALVSKDRTDYFSVPVEQYEEFDLQFPPLPPEPEEPFGKWIRVDAKYVTDLVPRPE